MTTKNRPKPPKNPRSRYCTPDQLRNITQELKGNPNLALTETPKTKTFAFDGIILIKAKKINKEFWMITLHKKYLELLRQL